MSHPSPRIKSIALLITLIILTGVVDRLPGLIINILSRSFPIIYSYANIWFLYGSFISYAILGIIFTHWSRRIYRERRSQLRLIILGIVTFILIVFVPNIILLLGEYPKADNLDFALLSKTLLVWLSLKPLAMVIGGILYWHVDCRRNSSSSGE